MSGPAKTLLVVEDGHEYEEFARLFLGDSFEITACRSAAAAVRAVQAEMPDAMLLDLRFDRTPTEDLTGDIEGTLVSSGRKTPFSASFSKFGMRPSRMNFVTRPGSMPSRPRITTRRARARL